MCKHKVALYKLVTFIMKDFYHAHFSRWTKLGHVIVQMHLPRNASTTHRLQLAKYWPEIQIYNLFIWKRGKFWTYCKKIQLSDYTLHLRPLRCGPNIPSDIIIQRRGKASHNIALVNAAIHVQDTCYRTLSAFSLYWYTARILYLCVENLVKEINAYTKKKKRILCPVSLRITFLKTFLQCLKLKCAKLCVDYF